MPNINTDSIVLSFKNALIMGHCPEAITMDQVANKHQKEPTAIAKFGLFETATPNYTNYYPDVKAEDLVPKDEDFFMPLVRALSQVTVHKNVNPVDFGDGDVLKNSMDKLYGQTVYVDHETAIGNAIGTIAELSWENAYTSTEGYKVPAGINAKLKIDGKSNPRLVRLMAMDPPGIHSFSVTVSFNWKQSHPAMSQEEFMAKLGSHDDKGVMYRRIATEVNSYREISLVNHGADPFAQIIKDGQIVNPKYANLVYNKADGTKGVNADEYDFKIDTISNSAAPSIPKESNIINNETPQNMKEILALLAATFQLTTDNKDDATLSAELSPKLTEYISNQAEATQELTTLKAAALTHETKVTELTEEITALKAQITLQPEETKELAEYTTNLRAETLRLHTLSNKNIVDEGIKSLIEKASPSTLLVLKNNYQKQVDEIMPLTCTSCRSTNVSRASAVIPKASTTPKVLDKNAASKDKAITKMHG